MSIHKSILKGIRTGVQQRVQQKFAGPAIAAGIGRVLPAIGRAVMSPGGRIAIGTTAAAELFRTFTQGAAGGACPSGSHLNKQDGVGGAAGTYCVKNRRMNFGNARAARRGVRRLKGARKLLRDIEKMMPTKTRTRRAQHATPSPIIHTR